MHYLAMTIREAKPFVWSGTADDILESVGDFVSESVTQDTRVRNKKEVDRARVSEGRRSAVADCERGVSSLCPNALATSAHLYSFVVVMDRSQNDGTPHAMHSRIVPPGPAGSC